uniref:F5/8 type C domain-containing protein n=1 Tax=Branchiostoma floridae TaxID=7739 RepID=C3XQ00_BRAFL|eukprot:XP_002614012.1 hypothetical protein BRAFLDRAFT_67404 [Branchiostoma floridae]
MAEDIITKNDVPKVDGNDVAKLTQIRPDVRKQNRLKPYAVSNLVQNPTYETGCSPSENELCATTTKTTNNDNYGKNTIPPNDTEAEIPEHVYIIDDNTNLDPSMAYGVAYESPNPSYMSECNSTKRDADNVVPANDNKGNSTEHNADNVVPGNDNNDIHENRPIPSPDPNSIRDALNRNPMYVPNVPQQPRCHCTYGSIGFAVIITTLLVSLIIFGTWLYFNNNVREVPKPGLGTPYTNGHPAENTTYANGHSAVDAYTNGHPAVDTTYTNNHPAEKTTYTSGHPAENTTYTNGHPAENTTYTNGHPAENTTYANGHSAVDAYTNGHPAVDTTYTNNHPAEKTTYTSGHPAENTTYTNGHPAENTTYTNGHPAENTTYTNGHPAENTTYTNGHPATRTDTTYIPANAFDGDTGTYWLPCLTRQGEEWFIAVDLVVPHTLTRVGVNTYGDIRHDMAAFELQIRRYLSQHAFKWEAVVTVTDVKAGTKHRQEFGGFQETERHWRFLITKTHSHQKPWLRELSFYGISPFSVDTADAVTVVSRATAPVKIGAAWLFTVRITFSRVTIGCRVTLAAT